MVEARPKVTLRHVASRAYVSVATASLSLRDKPGISPETRAHVKAVAAALGYRAQATSVLLRSENRPVVGILMATANPLLVPAPERCLLACLVLELGNAACLINVLTPGKPLPPIDVLIVLDNPSSPLTAPPVSFGTRVIRVVTSTSLQQQSPEQEGARIAAAALLAMSRDVRPVFEDAGFRASGAEGASSAPAPGDSGLDGAEALASTHAQRCFAAQRPGGGGPRTDVDPPVRRPQQRRV